MKKLRLFMPILAMILMSFGFVGCKPDDGPGGDPVDPTTIDPTAGLTTAQMMQNVVGTYNGVYTQKTIYSNSTQTAEFNCYMKLSIDPESNNYVKFSDVKYNYLGTWTPLPDYPKGFFSISASNKMYTLKDLNSTASFNVTSTGLLPTITFYDGRDSKGIGEFWTFSGKK